MHRSLLQRHRVLRDFAPATLNRRSWRSGSTSLSVLCVLVCLAPRALAAEPVRLQWVRLEGASTCIDATTLATLVQKRLGSEPFAQHAKRSIEGVVRREAGVWRAEIAVRAQADDQEPPLRTLTSTAPDCAALSSAVVLAVALAIDPEAALSSGVAEKAPPAATSVPAAPVAAPPPSRPLPARVSPQRPATGHAAASAVAQAGLLPHASFGATIVAAADVSRAFELGVHARIFPAVHGTGEPRFEIGATWASLQLCGRLPFDLRALLRVCAGPAFGLVQGVLLSGARSQPGERVWLGTELGAEVSLNLTHSLSFLLGAGSVVPITRYRFKIDGADGELFRQAAVAGIAHVGLELRFGATR